MMDEFHFSLPQLVSARRDALQQPSAAASGPVSGVESVELLRMPRNSKWRPCTGSGACAPCRSSAPSPSSRETSQHTHQIRHRLQAGVTGPALWGDAEPATAERQILSFAACSHLSAKTRYAECSRQEVVGR